MATKDRPNSANLDRRPNSAAPKGRIYIAIDTESTGIEPDTGEVIEVAVLRFRLEPGGRVRVLEEWQTLVRPQNPIPYKITNLTGIAQADVENAPSFFQIKDKLRAMLGTNILVGHSIESDIGFLRRQNFEVLNPTIDTYELATLALPQQANYSLKAIAETLGVHDGTAHRALADAKMTMDVFGALAGRIEQLPTEILEEVNSTARRMLTPWSLQGLFQEAFASTQEETGGGAVSNLGALLKLKLAEQSKQPAATGDNNLGFLFLAQEEKSVTLEPQPIAENHFQELANRVALPIREAFANKTHLLLECPGDMPGSETERAVGMVVAAVDKARREGKCVVLTASSDARRERLLHHIIPTVQENLGRLEGLADSPNRRKRSDALKAFKVSLVKNQQNYLCLRRWESFRQSGALTDDELKFLIRLLVWLPNTTEGDCTELRINPNDRLWARVSSQRGLCTPELCNRPDRPRCFFYRAKDHAQASHLVVADHQLVLADLVGQAGTLPETNWIILDDAHSLEDEASRQFGTILTPYQLFNFLDWLSRPVTWKPGGGPERTGFLHSLDKHFKPDTTAEIKELLTTLIQEATKQVDYARDAAGTLLREVSYILAQHNQESGQADGRIRLDQKFRNGAVWAESVGLWEGFHTHWDELYYRLADLRDETSAVAGSLTKTVELATDLEYYVNQSNYLLNKMTAAFETGENGQIFWIGATRLHAASSAAKVLSEGENNPVNEKSGVNIYSAPLEVAPVLEQRLFDRVESVALVSATLSTQADFNFIKDRLGLDHYQPTEVRLPPSRNYSAALLCLPADMPEPNQAGYQKMVDQQIMEMVKTNPGRTVAVFSSNSALRLTYKAVQRPLEANKILVLGQGLDGSRRSMMHRFCNTERAILLTSLNFWETAELQSGEEDAEAGIFNLLIISKLPFDAPTDPLFAARVEGKLFDRPFEQYGLPRTILRFRQAFDRLLVGQPERSAVIMLDSRLTSKAYGEQFLNSLPPLTLQRGSLGQLNKVVGEWLS